MVKNEGLILAGLLAGAVFLLGRGRVTSPAAATTGGGGGAGAGSLWAHALGVTEGTGYPLAVPKQVSGNGADSLTVNVVVEPTPIQKFDEDIGAAPAVSYFGYVADDNKEILVEEKTIGGTATVSPNGSSSTNGTKITGTAYPWAAVNKHVNPLVDKGIPGIGPGVDFGKKLAEVLAVQKPSVKQSLYANRPISSQPIDTSDEDIGLGPKPVYPSLWANMGNTPVIASNPKRVLVAGPGADYRPVKITRGPASGYRPY